MPILWIYILKGYFRVFALSILSFILILLVSRFKEIARFTALSDDATSAFLFIIYQIPLILPLAIPVSSFIAAFLLCQRLSRSFELTAMRASGMSLHQILAPILISSFFLTVCNFILCAEIFPASRRASKSLFYEQTSSNPLLLLGRKSLIKIKKSFLQIEENQDEKIMKNMIFISPYQNHKLMLISAKQLEIKGKELKGENISFISYLNSTKEQFDPLIIEQEKSMTTDAFSLSVLLKKRRPCFDAGSLNIPMLRLMGKESNKKWTRSQIEILRRTILSLTTFTMTLIGSAFGILIGRTPSKKHLFVMASLLLLTILSYLVGKEYKSQIFIAAFILATPHLFSWIFSYLRIHKIAKGNQ